MVVIKCVIHLYRALVERGRRRCHQQSVGFGWLELIIEEHLLGKYEFAVEHPPSVDFVRSRCQRERSSPLRVGQPSQSVMSVNCSRV